MKTENRILLILLCIAMNLSAATGQERSASLFRHTLETNLLLGENQTAHGAMYSSIYLLAEDMGIGPSIGFIDYDTRLSESMMNLGIRTEYELFRFSKFRTTLTLDGGIGIPFYEGKGEWQDSPFWGQAFIRPAIGLAIDSQSGAAMMFKGGYHYQTLTTESIPDAINRQELRYKRWYLSFGIGF